MSAGFLVDRNRRTRWERGTNLVCTDGGSNAERAATRGQARELDSGSPVVASEPWPANVEMVGEAVWVAQTWIEPRRG